MQTQEIAKQSAKMANHVTQCCMDGSSSCFLTPRCWTTLCIFGILVIIALILIIVMQGKIVKELRKIKKK